MKNLELVIGLFCGWALSYKELSRLIKEKAGPILFKGWTYRPVGTKSWNFARKKESLKSPWKKYKPAFAKAADIVMI